MTEKEKELMRKAVNEIRSLQKANEFMAAQLNVLSLCERLLDSTPRAHGNAVGEDVAYSLMRHLAEQEEKVNAKGNKIRKHKQDGFAGNDSAEIHE